MIPIAVMAALVVAQGGTEIARSGTTSHLIVDARVQRELRLAEPQKVAVWDIRWKTSGRVGDLYREQMKRDEIPDYRKRLEAEARINAAMVAELAGVLDREQFARYEQIRLQYLREEALLDPGVQRALRMDPGQVEKAVSLFVGYLEAYARMQLDSKKRPFPEQMRLASRSMRENIERREATLKQMRALLTDEQRASLDALRGPTFKPTGREPVGSVFEQAPMPEAVKERIRREAAGPKPTAPPSPPPASPPRR